MLLNYLKIGWRSLRREGGFALLNALGLAIGIAAVVLVGLYVANELAIAWHHPDGDRVFRVIRRTEVSGAEASYSAGVSAGIGPDLAAASPDVEGYARMINWSHDFFWGEKRQHLGLCLRTRRRFRCLT